MKYVAGEQWEIQCCAGDVNVGFIEDTQNVEMELLNWRQISDVARKIY